MINSTWIWGLLEAAMAALAEQDKAITALSAPTQVGVHEIQPGEDGGAVAAVVTASGQPQLGGGGLPQG